MKTSIYLLNLFIMVAFAAKSQNHITAKVNLTKSLWTQYNPEFPSQVASIGTYTEDTVLDDGITYLKLYINQSDKLTTQSKFEGGIRFDSISGKVYFRYAEESPWFPNKTVILCDFGLNTGDTISAEKGYHLINFLPDTAPPSSIVVNKIDTVTTLDNISRKRYHFGGSSFWIEGVGNVGRIFLAILNSTTTGHEPQFGCYKQNGNCIYAANNCNKCFGDYVGVKQVNNQLYKNMLYPNPANNKLYVTTTQAKPTQVLVYDLSGQLVLNKQVNALFEQTEIDISILQQGMYWCVLKDIDGAAIFNNKFIKQ